MLKKREKYGYNLDYTDDCLANLYAERLSPIECKNTKLKTLNIESGTVLPLRIFPGKYRWNDFGQGGIVDKNGIFLSESTIPPARVGGEYEYDKDSIKYEDKEVIYAGIFFNHWGHFIIEEISRLYYFLNEEDKNLPIIYISHNPLSGNYLEFFELLGIDPSRLIWVNKITKFKKIIIPEVSMIVQKYYTNEYKKIFDTICEKIKPLKNGDEKIFYTTRNFCRSAAKDWGEIDKIEDFFVQNGYKIFSPENLTLKEQISIIKSCKEFAAVSGTLPHNLIFANPDIKAIIINKSCILNYNQSLTDSVKGIRPINIDCHLSFFPSHIGSGPFFFYFSKNLIRYANDHKMKIPQLQRKTLFKGLLKNLTETIVKRESEYEFNYSFMNYIDYYLKQIPNNWLLKFYMKNQLYRFYLKDFKIRLSKTIFMILKYKKL